MRSLIIAITALFASSVLAASPSATLRQALKAECPQYNFSSGDATLSAYNPPPQVLRQVPLPGNTQILYRGAYEDNAQFDSTKVIKGLLGETGWVVGSPMFFGISQVLKGAKTLDDPFLPKGQLDLKIKRYLEARDIRDDVELLLQCRSPKFYSELEAAELAKDLSTKTFERMRPDKVEKNYLNLKDPQYYSSHTQEIGFGNNAADFVTASYNDQVSSIYGRKVMVIKDKKGRGVDLGYWNFQNNKYFWDSWVDNGEIDIPGYIQAEDLIGYQHRAIDRLQKGWGGQNPNNPIQYALYRTQVAGVPAILVVDGAKEICLVQDETSGKVYFCKDAHSARVTKDIAPPPLPRGNTWRDQAPLIGILMVCQDGKNCPVPQKIFTDYKNVREASLDPALLAAFEKITVNGRPVKFLRPADGDLPKIGRLKVISATYATTAELTNAQGNVTAPAAAYIDGKTEVNYRVSTRHLKVPADRQDKEFVVEFVCSNDLKNRITKRITAPAEGKTVPLSCDE
jgi:hypothetical protein